MPQDPDPGIPTLTQRVEPSFTPQAPQPTPTTRQEVPVLTDTQVPASLEVVESAPWDNEDLPVLSDLADTASALTDTPGLRAALQAEFDQTLQQAIDEATTLVRTRLEAALPAMIERALDKVRNS